MASSYSTDLKLELQVTGENAGTWGDITNTNLVILQQAIAGYQSVAVNATTGLTLTFTNGATSDGKNAVLQLTGTPTTNININVPDGIEKTYIVDNQIVHGTNTVTFKTTSGTGVKLAQGNIMDTKVPKKLKPVEAPKVKEVDTAKTDLVVQRLDTLIQYMELLS